MRIGRFQPPLPPREFTLTFNKNEGWVVVAALHRYADAHPQAVEREQWEQWSKDLDAELRR
jgi:hypothetical protein